MTYEVRVVNLKMLDGDMDALNEYSGQYMVEYSWAEMKNASIHFDNK